MAENPAETLPPRGDPRAANEPAIRGEAPFEALRESEERYRLLVEQALNMIAIHCDGRIVFVNAAGCQMLKAGCADELLGKPILEIVHPDFHAQTTQRIQAIQLAEMPSTKGRNRLVCQDGTFIEVEIVGAPILFQGRPAVQIVVRDVSEQLRTLEALAVTQSLLNDAEQMAGLGCWAHVLSTNAITWSDQLYRIYGLSPEEGVADLSTLLATIHPDDRSSFLPQCEKLYADGQPFSVEFRIQRPDGEVRQILAKGTMSLDAQGQAYRAMGIAQDITERKENERMKNSFLASVSHEMRTPLTTLQFTLELIAQGALDLASARGQAVLKGALDNTDYLVRLVNDLLEIERLEAGQIALDSGPCDARQLIEDAVAIGEPDRQTEPVTIESPAESFTLLGDPLRLKQVLANLLSNARKFSAPGSPIRVGVTRERDCAHFTVRDQGRGIPAQMLETIFDRFKQVQTADFHLHKGVGLGLSICRGIVLQHGGRIWVESGAGAGSCFHFTVPLVDRSVA